MPKEPHHVQAALKVHSRPLKWLTNVNPALWEDIKTRPVQTRARIAKRARSPILQEPSHARTAPRAFRPLEELASVRLVV